MNVITVKRAVFRQANEESRPHRSFRELTRSYFASEKSWEFVIEALLFAIIVAISAWPIVVVAGARSTNFFGPRRAEETLAFAKDGLQFVSKQNKG